MTCGTRDHEFSREGWHCLHIVPTNGREAQKDETNSYDRQLSLHTAASRLLGSASNLNPGEAEISYAVKRDASSAPLLAAKSAEANSFRVRPGAAFHE